MAVIHPLPSEGSSPEAAARYSRPAILVRDGSFQTDAREPWRNLLEQHRSRVEHAIRAVGRLETDHATIPWVGTAFLIEPRCAVTATFVAEALVRGSLPDDSSTKERSRLEGVWINLKSEYGSPIRERIAIRDVRFVHPYWGFAFLDLAQPVEADRILLLASNPSPEEELNDRDICVIGYPGLDVRNDPKVQKAIFGDIYDVKRVMPGKIIGQTRWGSEETITLQHDATTSGGTSGAPVIDLRTGRVLGIQVGGIYLQWNFAVVAWEIGRDPQWSNASNGERDGTTRSVAAAALQSIESMPQDTPILKFEEVLQLQDALVKIGVTDQDKILTLFGGLPKEYVGALPDRGGGASERLLAMLHSMNEIGGRIGEHSGFYYLLNNAERMRSWDANWKQKVQVWLTMVLERERNGRD